MIAGRSDIHFLKGVKFTLVVHHAVLKYLGLNFALHHILVFQLSCITHMLD